MCLFIVLFSALIVCLVCDWGPLIFTFGVKKKLLKSRTVSCNIIHCMQRDAFFFFLYNPFTPHVSFAQWSRPNESIKQHEAGSLLWGDGKRLKNTDI